MRAIGIRELRQHASRHLRDVEAGETIEVTGRGRPIARLTPVPRATGRDALIASRRLKPAAVALLDVHPIPGHRHSRLSTAQKAIANPDLVPMDDTLLDAAGALAGETLRSLDAIHIASAWALGSDLTELVTYDRRMRDVAAPMGLTVRAPG